MYNAKSQGLYSHECQISKITKSQICVTSNQSNYKMFTTCNFNSQELCNPKYLMCVESQELNFSIFTICETILRTCFGFHFFLVIVV